MAGKKDRPQSPLAEQTGKSFRLRGAEARRSPEERIDIKEAFIKKVKKETIKMKKLLYAVAAAGLSISLLTGCGSKAPDEEGKTIVIGASPSPHAEILAEAGKLLDKQGYTLEIKEYNDYVQPNVALDAGDLDANYFQHQPYLDQFNEERKMELVSAGMIHYEPFGIYAGKISSLEALPDGAQVAVPNDTTNEARALLLLEANGLITLKEGAGLNATRQDVIDNPKNIDIIEMEAAQIPRSLPDVEIAVINGNYAISAGLKVSEALACEDSGSVGATTYGNVVAVKKGHESDEKIKALIEVLKSEEIQKFVEEKYEGAVVLLP